MVSEEVVLGYAWKTMGQALPQVLQLTLTLSSCRVARLLREHTVMHGDKECIYKSANQYNY